MKLQQMTRAAYETTYGALRQSRTSPETWELFDKVRKLPLTEFLILEPEKGEKLGSVRSSWYSRLVKITKQTNSPFRVRLAINRSEGHILLWKEPKKSA
jgi:hypothetical protein